jgi:hypothetical protein
LSLDIPYPIAELLSLGTITTPLKIFAPSNVQTAQRIIPIKEIVNFPRETFTFPTSHARVKIASVPLSGEAGYLVTVLTPLTFKEIIAVLLFQISYFFKGSIPDLAKIILAAFATAFAAWVINKFSKKHNLRK